MIPLLEGRRLVIVHNPHSSRADEVQRSVFAKLDAKAYKYETLEVKQVSLTDNIARLSPQIHSGDVIISAAGDGSAHALSQAVMAADKDNVTVGFLAFGNFNDLPHTFISGKSLKDPIEFLRQARQETIYPLVIEADGQYIRQALLYVTLGWTAKAASQFDNPGVRRHLQTGKVSLIRTLWRLGLYYLKSRRHSYLPTFTDNHKLYSHQTDILCVNGSSMARLFRTGVKYYETDTFLHHSINVSRLLPNIPFLIKSIFGHMPGNVVKQMSIEFQIPENLPLQCDGEVVTLGSITKLHITKSTVPFHVLTTRE